MAAKKTEAYEIINGPEKKEKSTFFSENSIYLVADDAYAKPVWPCYFQFNSIYIQVALGAKSST